MDRQQALDNARSKLRGHIADAQTKIDTMLYDWELPSNDWEVASTRRHIEVYQRAIVFLDRLEDKDRIANR